MAGAPLKVSPRLCSWLDTTPPPTAYSSSHFMLAVLSAWGTSINTCLWKILCMHSCYSMHSWEKPGCPTAWTEALCI